MAELLTFPISISHIQGRYLLFDINAITYLRKHHRICGVFIGTLPQNPSQNVFMGLPMEIMPEEAQVLIDDAVACIVDDARAHDVALAKANRQRQGVYVRENEAKAAEIAEEKVREKDFERRRALKKVGVGRKKGVESMGSSTETVTAAMSTAEQLESEGVGGIDSTNPSEESESLFDAPLHQINNSNNPSSTTIISTSQSQLLHITPSTSTSLLSSPSTTNTHPIPLHPPSYALYSHLHHQKSPSYFLTPGLRFGCQFCVYPGDPLRFHSHFLAVGYGWEEEIDLMDFVGGGRLGTGVKKGWLVGGREGGRDSDGGDRRVRTWSVEWAGM